MVENWTKTLELPTFLSNMVWHFKAIRIWTFGKWRIWIRIHMKLIVHLIPDCCAGAGPEGRLCYGAGGLRAHRDRPHSDVAASHVRSSCRHRGAHDALRPWAGAARSRPGRCAPLQQDGGRARTLRWSAPLLGQPVLPGRQVQGSCHWFMWTLADFNADIIVTALAVFVGKLFTLLKI